MSYFMRHADVTWGKCSCRILALAMVTTWRCDRDDQLPNGRQLATEWLSQIWAALGDALYPVTRGWIQRG